MSAADMAEIDAMLDAAGGDLVLPRWKPDRPITPAEALACLRKHECDPATVAPDARREVVRACAGQLRLQCRAFIACANALDAGDASMVPIDNPRGSGNAEVRALLFDAAELGPLLPDDAARVALVQRHRCLADQFRAAAALCADAADCLDEARFRLHAPDYIALIRQRLAETAAEADDRRRALAAGGEA